MSAIFGPGGNSEDFYADGRKSSLQIPQWLHTLGLRAYEYECGHGVRISADAAEDLGASAKKFGISLSVHAPYYISLSSEDAEKREKSVGYIMQTLTAARKMGATRIVVHSGSCAKITRRQALDLAKNTLHRALAEAKSAGLDDIFICPETMGKVNQLGNVQEVMALCALDERLLPTIDFGHVNAQTIGGLKTKADFEAIFDVMHDKMGAWRAAHFHAHYSRIEYTNSGEKTHRCFDETEYEPEFDPIAQIVAERELSPVIICESRGTQTQDALKMQAIYQNYRRTLEEKA